MKLTKEQQKLKKGAIKLNKNDFEDFMNNEDEEELEIEGIESLLKNYGYELMFCICYEALPQDVVDTNGVENFQFEVTARDYNEVKKQISELATKAATMIENCDMYYGE